MLFQKNTSKQTTEKCLLHLINLQRKAACWGKGKKKQPVKHAGELIFFYHLTTVKQWFWQTSVTPVTPSEACQPTLTSPVSCIPEDEIPLTSSLACAWNACNPQPQVFGCLMASVSVGAANERAGQNGPNAPSHWPTLGPRCAADSSDWCQGRFASLARSHEPDEKWFMWDGLLSIALTTNQYLLLITDIWWHNKELTCKTMCCGTPLNVVTKQLHCY